MCCDAYYLLLMLWFTILKYIYHYSCTIVRRQDGKMQQETKTYTFTTAGIQLLLYRISFKQIIL